MTQHENGNWLQRKWTEWSLLGKAGIIVTALVGVTAFFGLFAAITMWLWNWLMPTIFNLPAIGFWQAVGLLILSHILFKGGHVGRAGKSRWKKAKIRKQIGEELSEPQ
jgi:hypothetical protein